MSQKGLVPILIVLLIALVIGGYLIYQKQTKPVVPQPVTQPSPSPIASPAASNSAEMANWKTYKSDKLKISFKFPDTYTQRTTETENVYLVKDVVYTSGGGQSGSNVLKKGAIISVTLFPTKSITEKDLKSQYGSDIKINQITVDQKQGVEVILPNSQADKNTYFQRDNGVLEVSLGLGFENNASENERYASDFNQILSTFKFTQ